jgi:hypothetical protein
MSGYGSGPYGADQYCGEVTVMPNTDVVLSSRLTAEDMRTMTVEELDEHLYQEFPDVYTRNQQQERCAQSWQTFRETMKRFVQGVEKCIEMAERRARLNDQVMHQCAGMRRRQQRRRK